MNYYAFFIIKSACEKYLAVVTGLKCCKYNVIIYNNVFVITMVPD